MTRIHLEWILCVCAYLALRRCFTSDRATFDDVLDLPVGVFAVDY